MDSGARWWMQVHPSYWAPALALFLFALLAPGAWFAEGSALQQHAQGLSAIFPWLGAVGAGGTKAAVRAASLLLLPVAVLLPFVFVWRDRHRVLQQWLDARVSPPAWLELALLGMVAAVAAGTWLLGGEPQACRQCAEGSRFGLAWLTAGALLVAAIAPIGIATSLYIRLCQWVGTKEKSNE